MKCQACGDENRQDVIWRIDRPKNAFDAGHTLFCCSACGHVYALLEADPPVSGDDAVPARRQFVRQASACGPFSTSPNAN